MLADCFLKPASAGTGSISIFRQQIQAGASRFIMDMCGFPKNIYYYYKSWWTDKDVLHISPHWNWKGKEGQPIDVWVNTNADNAKLFLKGKSLGKKDMPRNKHLQWSVPYQPGKLEVVAYKKGRQLSARTETTG